MSGNFSPLVWKLDDLSQMLLPLQLRSKEILQLVQINVDFC